MQIIFMIMHLNKMSILWNYWLSNVWNSYGILIPNQVSLRKWYVAPNNIKTFLGGPKKCRQVICYMYDVYFLSLSETIFVFYARLHLNPYTSWLFVHRKFTIISHAKFEQGHSNAELSISTGHFSKVEGNTNFVASS